MDISIRHKKLTSIDGYVVSNGRRAIICLRFGLTKEQEQAGEAYLRGLCVMSNEAYARLWKVGDEVQ